MRLAFLLAVLVVLGPARLGAAETITSDTVTYCDALAARMAVREALPQDARLLLAEGLAMCQRGHVVGGLRRLRTAAVIMRGRPAP